MTVILFDLDRTLIDVQTYTDYAAALDDVESMIGNWDDPPTPPTGWDGATRAAMGILVALAGDPRWDSVSRLIARHERAAVEKAEPMPGMGEALRAVGRSGVAVVTLLDETVAREVLDRHEVAIEVVVGRRPDLGVKPAPDQLLEACRILGVDPSEATMIGDSTWDATAAGAAGCRFVGVTNGRPGEFPPEVATVETVDQAVSLLG